MTNKTVEELEEMAMDLAGEYEEIFTEDFVIIR